MTGHRLTDRHLAMLRERGVVVINDDVVFTLESKVRVERAMKDSDLSGLNPYELAALRLMRVIEEKP